MTPSLQPPALIPLHDGRHGLRTLLQIETREPAADTSASPGGEGRGEGGTAVLDFISSTATLDRYHEIIDPAGWRLDSYRRNPVFQNAHNYGDILFTLGKALITEVRAHPRPSDGRGTGGDGAPHSELRAPHCRRRYLEQELLEVSAVAIPANPDALALGVKTGAITKADLADTLDLLRSLTVDYGPWRPPHNLARPATSDRSGPSDPLLTFARELRRILRRT